MRDRRYSHDPDERTSDRLTIDRTPRNRTENDLHPDVVEIVHADGTFRTDRNGIRSAIVAGLAISWRPEPGRTSVVDGKPAVAYRTSEIEVSLTVDQLAGLVGRELTRREFSAIMGHHGDFHEIHDDFYHPTGDPMQRKGVRRTFRLRTRRYGPDAAVEEASPTCRR